MDWFTKLESDQSIIDDLHASKTVSFRNRPMTSALWGLLLVIPLFACMWFVVLDSIHHHAIIIDMQTILVIFVFGFTAIYNFRQAVLAPSVISLSLESFFYKDFIFSWNDVSSIQIVGGKSPSVTIFLHQAIEVNVRFYWGKVLMSELSIPYSSMENPKAFIECIKECSGGKFKGVVSLFGSLSD